jgi:hypothetical protein
VEVADTAAVVVGVFVAMVADWLRTGSVLYRDAGSLTCEGVAAVAAVFWAETGWAFVAVTSSLMSAAIFAEAIALLIWALLTCALALLLLPALLLNCANGSSQELSISVTSVYYFVLVFVLCSVLPGLSICICQGLVPVSGTFAAVRCFNLPIWLAVWLSVFPVEYLTEFQSVLVYAISVVRTTRA